MKLTKDYFIEGQIIKAGTELKIKELKESSSDQLMLVDPDIGVEMLIRPFGDATHVYVDQKAKHVGELRGYGSNKKGEDIDQVLYKWIPVTQGKPDTFKGYTTNDLDGMEFTNSHGYKSYLKKA
ncbi:MAG: hypothetical protein PF569_02280 [Candidatus Woesearchaeota archaeon]|jgi:hypothetical protein|nr:hypothetical protein [Candidatus Woesearchaeota archaeon]